MSIVPASRLSLSDLALLGNNTMTAVMSDRMDLRAVNRSLTVHGERIRKLFNRKRVIRKAA